MDIITYTHTHTHTIMIGIVSKDVLRKLLFRNYYYLTSVIIFTYYIDLFILFILFDNNYNKLDENTKNNS